FFISKNQNGAGTIDGIILPQSSSKTSAENRSNLGKTLTIYKGLPMKLSFPQPQDQAERPLVEAS
ncbi:MAG: hypothetical protein ABIU29_06370, partial [Chthoniobacterales bacterium]